MGVLDQLVAAAREEAERRSHEVPLPELERQIGARGHDRPFAEAISRPGLSLIAEFKRRSPSSREELRPGGRVAEVVRAYEEAGAAALSVLTQQHDFGGSLEDLREAHSASNLPVLRKDFIVDEYQLFESAAAGADAVLLIAAALETERLAELHREARHLDLDCIVEVHDAEELGAALEVGADVIGINNRDLRTLEVRLETTHELIADIPAGKSVVSESGISSRDQVLLLQEVGVDAVLIGESLMRAEDPGALIAGLLPADDATREHAR